MEMLTQRQKRAHCKFSWKAVFTSCAKSVAPIFSEVLVVKGAKPFTAISGIKVLLKQWLSRTLYFQGAPQFWFSITGQNSTYELCTFFPRTLKGL